MFISRRKFVGLTLAAGVEKALGQQKKMVSRVFKQNATPPSRKGFGAYFVDVAEQAGLHEPVIYGEVGKVEYILEADGCGCAFIDYDNDGWMDLFILCGTRLSGPPPGATNRLYKNNRDGTFTDVTEEAGLHHVGWANSVCVGDYNNDGFEDLFCTYFGQNKLYRNNGNGTFTDVTEEAGLAVTDDPTTWNAGCSFIDYDRDGNLDLFVSQYVQFDLKTIPKPGEDINCQWKGIPVNCGPRGLPPGFPGKHVLFKNNGKGVFKDVTEQAKLSAPRTCFGMTVVAADFDEDGWTDIYVACDSTPSLLYLNNHDGTFRQVGIERGVALSASGMEQSGMGVGIGDYVPDGHLDIFKTNFADDTPDLYKNDGKANFADATTLSGIGAKSRFTSWGAGIVDLDNDGYPDIFFVTGSVYPEVAPLLPRYPYKSPRILLRNLGNGKFEEVTKLAGPGVTAAHSSRGCAFGDFDNDGDIDVLVVNINEPPSLLRNDLKGKNHWVKIKLVGKRSNRSAIGARVLVHYGDKTQAQALMSQSSFFSSNDPRLHYGVGASTSVNVDIFWPSGFVEKLTNVGVDRIIVVHEGSGITAMESMACVKER